jgi:DNA-binding NarL/FixJ family response regulator
MKSLGLWRELSDDRQAADVIDSLGADAWHHGDYAEAQTYCEEALGLARASGLRELEANALYHLGLVAYDQMDWVMASNRHAESLRVATSLNDALSIARGLRGLALAAHQQGDYERARQLHEESLAKRREVGEPWGVALALVDLGQVLLDTRDVARAKALFHESLTLSQDLGSRQGLARSLEAFASLAAMTGRVEAGRQLVAAAQELRDDNQIPLSPAEDAQLVRRLESAGQALGEHTPTGLNAAGHALPLEQAVALARTIGPATGSSISGPPHAELLAPPEHDQGHPDASRSVLPDALTVRELEVLRLVAAGQTNKEIAEQLVLSVRTVERHINNLYAKIGARGKADATAYAFRHGLT